MFLYRASSSCCVLDSPNWIPWLWPHRCYSCVFEFPDARCRLWSPRWDCVEEIINENCLLSLCRINSELRKRLPLKPEIHDGTMARTLDGMLFGVKPARSLPAKRNGPDVLKKRVDYTTSFMNCAVVRYCVFLDKCGYNIWTPEVTVERGRERGRTVKCAASEY